MAVDTPHNVCKCSELFNDTVLYQGQEVDVLTLAGASPDAVVLDKKTGMAKAVFEAKCKSPFYLQHTGASLMSLYAVCIVRFQSINLWS
jgi:hypothetical protein